MNRIVQFIAAIIVLTAGASAFAAPTLTLQQCNDYPFVRLTGPVTHRQLINELNELEAFGYEPSSSEDDYPDDLEIAQRRLWAQYKADCLRQSPIATAPVR